MKTTMGYCLTPVRMATINKSTKQVLVRLWRKGNPSALLVGMQTGAATVGNSIKFPQKMELPFDPVIPLWGLYPKNTEIPIQKDLCTPMFIAAQFTIASARSNLGAHQ